MLGGPRTVRTDLFAAIALPVLTLVVLLYTASLLAVMHPSCGRLGCAVAVGMGNMFGSGETGRKCMFISPGVATRGLTGVQCVIRNDHNVVCARMRCSVTTIKVGDRFQNIAIISVIPNMVKAGHGLSGITNMVKIPRYIGYPRYIG